MDNKIQIEIDFSMTFIVNLLTIIKDQPGPQKSISSLSINVKKFFGVARITVYSNPSSNSTKASTLES